MRISTWAWLRQFGPEGFPPPFRGIRICRSRLPLRRGHAAWAAGTALRPRPGLCHGALRGLCLDEPGIGCGDIAVQPWLVAWGTGRESATAVVRALDAIAQHLATGSRAGPGMLPASPRPACGLRWRSVFWPSARVPLERTAVDASPPNVWKPHFVLAYALALVAFERVATLYRLPAAGACRAGATRRDSWAWLKRSLHRLFWGSGSCWSPCTSWATGAAVNRCSGARPRVRPMGPMLGTLFLAFGGGPISDALTGSSGSGLSLGWIADPGSRRPVGAFNGLPGGIGLLELGVVPVVAASLLMAWRNRLVWMTAAAAGCAAAGRTDRAIRVFAGRRPPGRPCPQLCAVGADRRVGPPPLERCSRAGGTHAAGCS